ncbi:hypothetical protein DRF65_13740 [Chryseobacterium pennae]|uniref:Uncharacterized protein n=1 Tax=Chryseobacterium pennae TaxID=2258962 RepID=A0A3D9C8A1_9FLAO|nr:hypothetical protein [Chryseobacterium pennae]REC61796.1 hypothetical protein DRF65_13740 [Chryseobacterium pennae]
METPIKYKFTDWLYNRFVENFKKKKIIEAFIFMDVLSNYQLFVQENKKLSDQRRHTRELYARIIKALKDHTADRLLLTGDERLQEIERELQTYEDDLRKIGCSEEYINQCSNERKTTYYGN